MRRIFLRLLVALLGLAGISAANAGAHEYRFVLDNCYGNGEAGTCEPELLPQYQEFFDLTRLVLTDDGVRSGASILIDRHDERPYVHESTGIRQLYFPVIGDLMTGCRDANYCYLNATFLDDGTGQLVGKLLLDSGETTFNLDGTGGTWHGLMAKDNYYFHTGAFFDGRWLLVPLPGTLALVLIGAVALTARRFRQ